MIEVQKRGRGRLRSPADVMRPGLPITAVTAVALLSHSAFAADLRHCSPPPEVQTVAFKALPTDVSQALQRQAGRIRDVWEGDGHVEGVYQDDFSSHPVFVWRSDQSWVVATDRLNPTYSIRIYRFSRDPRDETVGFDGVRAAFSNTACQAATDLVLGTDLKGR